MLIHGDKEVENGDVSVRHRKNGDLGQMDINELLKIMLADVKSKNLEV